mgnify:CR=1 FL=1
MAEKVQMATKKPDKLQVTLPHVHNVVTLETIVTGSSVGSLQVTKVLFHSLSMTAFFVHYIMLETKCALQMN